MARYALVNRGPRFPKRAERELWRALRMGPGGMNCTCCFEAPGPVRRKIFRAVRRKCKRAAIREGLADC